MNKSLVTVLSLTVLTAGAFAQAPSPAPTPEPAVKLENREHAQRGPMGERRGPGGGMGGMMETLGMERMVGGMMQNPDFAKRLALTPEQQDQIKRLALEQRTKMMEQQGALQKSAGKQVELLLADPLDEAALMAAVEETSKARTEMAKAGIQNLIEIRKVLTEEQRKQLREMMTQMKQRAVLKTGERREGFEKREGHGPKADGQPATAPAATPPPAPAI